MAEDKDSSQEKTEEATPKRLEESRQKGQVSRSRELNTMAILLVSAAAFYWLGGELVKNLLAIMRQGFVVSRADIFDQAYPPASFIQACFDAILGLTPLLSALFIIAFLAPIAVGGWAFSIQAMAFKWDKLDPISGIKRVLGVRGLMELAKAFAKFTVITGLLVLLLWLKLDELMTLGRNGLFPGLLHSAKLVVWAFLLLSASTIVIAAVDVPFQLWEHSRQLKMTKQEVKDEMKETEGKPEVKSQLRAMQQELANRRMLEEVPNADVVITNPSHYAVALTYKQDEMAAPILVAKGVDHMAERMRNIADQNQVIIFSSPLLARALYFNTKPGQEIPAGLFMAVAQVLAYVYQLNASRRNRHMHEPEKPINLPIPEDLRTE